MQHSDAQFHGQGETIRAIASEKANATPSTRRLRADETRLPSLGVSTDAMSNFQFIVSAVRRSWADNNKDPSVRYVRALASSFRYMRAPANRDEVARIVIETTGSAEDIARQTLALYFDPDRGVVPRQGEIDVKGFAQVIQVMSEAGELQAPLPSPERFVDLQYLKAAGIQ